MKDNDSKLIYERYKLISEIPASLEFASDTFKDKIDPKYKQADKIPDSYKRSSRSSNSRLSDRKAWASDKARELMKTTVVNGAAKGLDKRRAQQGKPPLVWRIIDANLTEGEHLINKQDISQIINKDSNLQKELTSPDGITVFMNPSGLDERSGMMAFSAWIRSHKCGHAIFDQQENYKLADNIKLVLRNYYKLYLEQLRDCKHLDLKEYPLLNEKLKGDTSYASTQMWIQQYEDLTNFYCDLFTFGSARNKQLRTEDNVEELTAQLMQTGKITINKMLDEKTIKTALENIDYYWGGGNEENKRKINIIKQSYNDMMNIEEYIATQIDQAIENCVGKILYDMV